MTEIERKQARNRRKALRQKRAQKQERTVPRRRAHARPPTLTRRQRKRLASVFGRNPVIGLSVSAFRTELDRELGRLWRRGCIRLDAVTGEAFYVLTRRGKEALHG